jgi:hypothetical protein
MIALRCHTLLRTPEFPRGGNTQRFVDEVFSFFQLYMLACFRDIFYSMAKDYIAAMTGVWCRSCSEVQAGSPATLASKMMVFHNG